MPKKCETVRIAVVGTGSSGNAYLVTVGDSKLLLDAGMPSAKVRKFNDNKLADIDAFLVTHTHDDHSKYVDEYMKTGIRFIYCETPVECGKFTVYSDMQSHDIPCRGYSIDFPEQGIMLHYITDTVAINVSEQYGTKPDRRHYWICECDYCEETMDYNDLRESADMVMRNNRTRETHLSDEQVFEYFKQTDKVFADAILLVHTSKQNFDYAEFMRTWERSQGLNKDLPKAVAAEKGAIYEMHGKSITELRKGAM